MKHNKKITLILMTMFVITQIIGLFVINYYLQGNIIPYGFDQREAIEQTPNFYAGFMLNFIISFILAVALVFLLMKVKSTLIIKVWFFAVISVGISITLNAFLRVPSSYSLIPLCLGAVIAYFKMFRRNVIFHNATELFVYPGIAAVFVSMLNLPVIIIVLILICIYDAWAVWKSKFMLKMAKFQINSTGILGGFLIPYASKKTKQKIKFLKTKYKNNIPEKIIKNSKIKVRLAILGGGDLVFPLIAAGVFLKTFNIYAALTVTLFSSIALLLLFIFGDQEKAYPAMPYLTAGTFLGMIIGWIVFVL